VATLYEFIKTDDRKIFIRLASGGGCECMIASLPATSDPHSPKYSSNVLLEFQPKRNYCKNVKKNLQLSIYFAKI
jgi:hypothetical protein